MLRLLVLSVSLLSFHPRIYAKETVVTSISPALTAGVGGVRAGATLDVAALTCRDSCGGPGLTIGYTDFSRQEYTIGAGLIAMYMGSLLLQGEIRIRERKFAGFHVTPGFGVMSGFGILRLGYDTLQKIAVVEIGLTVKLPLLGW